MNFKKKYYLPFKDLHNQPYTIEIWEDTDDVITFVEIEGSTPPFCVSFLGIDDKLTPVRGSGCELNLISETDRQFFGLYTAKIQQFQIRAYRGIDLIWCGYLDTELYSEPFNVNQNYDVTFSGSDGFAILERLNYLTPSDIELVEVLDPTHGYNTVVPIEKGKLPYTGIVTQWEIIKNILTKLNLPWGAIYVGISTESPEFTIADNENIFEKTFCTNENWYTEDVSKNAENCRTVLESILQPYGAFIIQDNANIYITDINTFAKGNTQDFKKYDPITFVYLQTVSINLALGDISSIGIAETSQDLTIVSAINEQIVKYSPYKKIDIVNYDATADFNTQLTSVDKGTVNTAWRWNEKTFDLSNTWNRFNNGRFCEGYSAFKKRR